MSLCALDVDKVVCYPPGLDFWTYEWLRKRGYKMVTVDIEEQRLFAPANASSPSASSPGSRCAAPTSCSWARSSPRSSDRR